MRIGSFFLFLLLAIASPGCAKSNAKPLYPVRGQIVYDGKPIPHAFVVLHPLDASAKESPRPRAKVQEDGSFVVETFGTCDGAPPGEYGVTVEWWLSSAKAGRGESDDAPASNRLPARYAKIETSGLRVQVREGDNEIPTIRLSR